MAFLPFIFSWNQISFSIENLTKYCLNKNTAQCIKKKKKKKSVLTGGKQQIVLKQTVLKEMRYQIGSNSSWDFFFSMCQVMKDKEGDVNTKLIKSSNDIGPGRVVYFRADGLKFLNDLANFRKWVEEKEDELE